MLERNRTATFDNPKNFVFTVEYPEQVDLLGILWNTTQNGKSVRNKPDTLCRKRKIVTEKDLGRKRK